MQSFNELQIRHQDLLELQKQSPDISDEALAYIDSIVESSSQISGAREREQLRANLRYWGTYIFEKTGRFPQADLQHAAGEPGYRKTLLYAGLIFLFLLMGWLTTRFIQQRAASAEATQLALILTLTETQKPTSTSTSSPTPIPTWTSTLPPSPTRTRTPTPTITPTPQPTAIDPGSISARLLSPPDGEDVSPETQLSGSYSNLQPGWSIHVVLQPLSQAGRLFPSSQSFIVPRGSTSGEWTLDVSFGRGEELEQVEEYNIKLVVAVDENARSALEGGVSSGLTELPTGIIPFPQTTTVRRGAYTAINETRILFPYRNVETNTVDIYSVRTDGTDLRQLLFTPLYGERNINLSPDGKKIAFITLVRDENEERVFAMFTLDIESGEDPQLIVEAPNTETTYEGPVWSPNGRYIVFSQGEQRPNIATTVWDIVMFDTETERLEKLTNDIPTDRYPSWADNSTIIFTARTGSTGTSGFVSMDIESREVALFYDTEAEEYQGSLSPDGRYLAYQVQLEDFTNEIYVANLETSETTRLTENAFQDDSPSWDPNGRTIYFVTFTTHPPSIEAVDIDGSNKRKIFQGDSSIRSFTVGHLTLFIPESQ